MRVENQTSKGGEETARAHFVIGLHELATDRYEVEPALFISRDGDVSERFQTSRELMLTQRLIVQACFETNAAIQRVERFTTGRGISNVEFGGAALLWNPGPDRTVCVFHSIIVSSIRPNSSGRPAESPAKFGLW